MTSAKVEVTCRSCRVPQPCSGSRNQVGHLSARILFRWPTSVAAEVVNGDGQPDVVVANIYSNSVGVLLNNTQADTTPPVITLSATPRVLWPPNGKMVPVTVFGTITDTGSGVNVNSAAYAVKDEYGKVQPTGAITLGPGGNYSFTVWLQASRLGTDLDGRRYAVTVRAKDNTGNGGSQTGAVTIPHDSEEANPIGSRAGRVQFRRNGQNVKFLQVVFIALTPGGNVAPATVTEALTGFVLVYAYETSSSTNTQIRHHSRSRPDMFSA